MFVLNLYCFVDVFCGYGIIIEWKFVVFDNFFFGNILCVSVFFESVM